MINFEQELNQEQLDVVKNGDGPCLVLAGAGSGKTRTITYRVAYLLEKGVSPENILLVTFTNKAANEMTERVQKITGLQNRLPWSGTFHHIANKILRHFSTHLGYQNNFSVLDSDDSEALIKKVIKEISNGEKIPSAKIIAGIISFARNSELSIEEVVDKKYPGYWPLSSTFSDISERYATQKRLSNAMDFDDLLVNFCRLLNLPEIKNNFANKFQYVLVDEYQDTNKLQASIINHLASIHKNILVVGDDAQSIYSFRAADIGNILNFEEKYPNAKIFRLETNYRSSSEILDLANNIIENNSNQYPKKLKAINGTIKKPELFPQADKSAEAKFIVKKISELLNQGVPSDHIAVLFRASHHSQALEIELAKAGINYDYRGGLRFFDRSHIKDALSYLRVINNLSDSSAWIRILQKEDGIGPVAANKIIAAIQTMQNIDEIKNLSQMFSGKTANGINNFLLTWEKLMTAIEVHGKNVGQLIAALIESPYLDYLQKEFLDADDRQKDLEQLSEFADKKENLSDFLAEAALQESFAHPNNKQAHTEKRLVLSTIHQAKGLEWSIVFIMNLANESFPNSRALKEENGLEEERRLFYVAATRARNELILTYPMSGDNWGTNSGPSLFLSEISQDLFDDHSFLGSSKFDDAEIQYIDEYDDIPRPTKIKPGSFLKSIDDL